MQSIHGQATWNIIIFPTRGADLGRVVVKESGGINSLDFAALRFSIAALAFVPFLPGALQPDETGETLISNTAHPAQAVIPRLEPRASTHLISRAAQFHCT